MRRAARRRPWAGMTWWKTSRTCPVKVGDFDTDMRLICREGLTESFFLSLEGVQRRGMILPACQVHDASELTGAPAASVLVMPHMLINPQHPNPRKNGQSHQMRLADTA